MQETLNQLDQLVSEPSTRPASVHSKPTTEKDKDEDAGNQDSLILITSIPLFSGLVPIHLERIMEIGQRLNYSAGQLLATKGTAIDGIYLIQQGSASKSVGDLTTKSSDSSSSNRQILAPGQCIGELAWADDNAKHPYDIYCEEACEILYIPQSSLRDLMFVDREFAHELLWRLLRRTMSRLGKYETDMNPNPE